MVVTTQALGRLDARLIDEERRFTAPPDLPPEDSVLFDDNEAFQDHLLLSYLWVLGAYELVRSIDQQCGDSAKAIGQPLVKEIRAVKQLFARVRVPLAKFEPARAHRDTDWRIAWPNVQPDSGIGWRVAADTVISRRLLADRLLEALERFSHSPRDPIGRPTV